MKYDLIGLVKVFFQIKNTNQAKWFCSRFVAEILSEGKSIDKDASLYRPSQLLQLADIAQIDAGEDFRHYNYRKARKALDALIAESKAGI